MDNNLFKLSRGVKRSGSKLFRLSKGVQIPDPKKRSARAPKLKDESDQPPFFVRGQPAGSKNEYWTGLALEKIEEQTGWGWEFQVSVHGGRRRRGGQVVDFLVYTPGRWTIVDVKGRYWHTGKHEDQQDVEDVARTKNWNLISFFTDETPTKEATYAYLRKAFHI